MIDIEKLNELPKRIGMHKEAVVKDLCWKSRHSDYHNVGDYSSWTICERVLTEFYGKHVNDAFTKYCTLVHKYQQKIFWETFERKRFSWYLDEYDNIQNDHMIPEWGGPYTIYSPDYKAEMLHKVTRHPRRRFRESCKHTRGKRKVTYTWEGGKYCKTSEREHYTATIDDFELVILEGWRIDCVSKNDPKYQRYVQEKAKARKKSDKEYKITKKLKEYSFLTKREQELKELAKLDIIKRDSHGFDEESFRGFEYHGRKNKHKILEI